MTPVAIATKFATKRL